MTSQCRLGSITKSASYGSNTSQMASGELATEVMGSLTTSRRLPLTGHYGVGQRGKPQ